MAKIGCGKTMELIARGLQTDPQFSFFITVKVQISQIAYFLDC